MWAFAQCGREFVSLVLLLLLLLLLAVPQSTEAVLFRAITRSFRANGQDRSGGQMGYLIKPDKLLFPLARSFAGRNPGVNLSGQALHAWKLTLVHPIFNQIIEAITPLPDDFTKLLEMLRRRNS